MMIHVGIEFATGFCFDRKTKQVGRQAVHRERERAEDDGGVWGWLVVVC